MFSNTGMFISWLPIYWNNRALQGPRELSDPEKQRHLQIALSSGYLLSWLQSLGRDAIFNQFPSKKEHFLFLIFFFLSMH